MSEPTLEQAIDALRACVVEIVSIPHVFFWCSHEGQTPMRNDGPCRCGAPKIKVAACHALNLIEAFDKARATREGR